jgi:hypothetical protein
MTEPENRDLLRALPSFLLGVFACADPPSPSTNWSSFDEVEGHARRIGCDYETSPETEYACRLFVGPCSCRIEFRIARRPSTRSLLDTVDLWLRECPAGDAGASERAAVAARAMDMLAPFLTPEDGDRARYEEIRDKLSGDAVPESIDVDPTLATVPIKMRSRARYGDVFAVFEWSSDVLELRRGDDDKHVQLFTLNTTTARVSLSGSTDDDPRSRVAINRDPPVTAQCLDRTVRPWQAYALYDLMPPDLESIPPRPDDWKPRLVAEIMKDLANTANPAPPATRPLPLAFGEALRLAAFELYDPRTEYLPPDLAKFQAKLDVEYHRAEEALAEITNYVDWAYERGVALHQDLRESGLERLFVFEAQLRRFFHRDQPKRRLAFLNATQPTLTLSGTR